VAKKKVNLFAKHTKGDDEVRLSDKSYLDDYIPPVEEKKEATIKKNIKSVVPIEKVEEKSPAIKRATIVVWDEDLTEFRNMIHTIKKSGNYQYTQKDAFARAVQLLKEEVMTKYGPLQDAPPPKKGRW